MLASGAPAPGLLRNGFATCFSLYAAGNGDSPPLATRDATHIVLASMEMLEKPAALVPAPNSGVENIPTKSGRSSCDLTIGALFSQSGAALNLQLH